MQQTSLVFFLKAQWMKILARVWLLIVIFVSCDFRVALHISSQKYEWVTDELLGKSAKCRFERLWVKIRLLLSLCMHSVLPTLLWGGANTIWTAVVKAAFRRRAPCQILQVKERKSTTAMIDASKSYKPLKISIGTAHSIKQSHRTCLGVLTCAYTYRTVNTHLVSYACACAVSVCQSWRLPVWKHHWPKAWRTSGNYLETYHCWWFRGAACSSRHWLEYLHNFDLGSWYTDRWLSEYGIVDLSEKLDDKISFFMPNSAMSKHNCS